MSARFRRASRGLLLACLLSTPALSAQTIGLTLGAGTRVSVSSGTRLTVPLNVDLTNAGGTTLGSLQAGVTWGIGKLRFDSVRVASGSGFALTTNTANVAAGQLLFNAYNPAGLASSGPLVNLYFTAGTTAGGTTIDLTPTAAGNLAGETIAAMLAVQGLDVCVAGSSWNTSAARWGDANGSGTVTVTDAQQLARYAVALSVTNLLATEERGDVNADGVVDVLDAFLVARFSAGLSAGTRVNTVMSVASDLPPVATVEVSTARDAIVVGQSRAFTATPRDANGVSLAGCYRVTWSSTNTARATVNSTTGVVLGKGVGTANIVAAAGGVSGGKVVEVQSPWKSMVAGTDHSCGVRANGVAFCFGQSSLGWTPVPGNHVWADISPGTNFRCGLTTSQAALCWGDNFFGNLGNGTNDFATDPTVVAGGRQWRAISAGEHHACGIDTSGATFCWGWNGWGQIGNNTTTSTNLPTAVTGDPGLAEVVAAAYVSCGVTAAGAGWCWGDGFGLVPVQMTTSVAWKTIVPGLGGACGVSTTGQAYCSVSPTGATLVAGGYTWTQLSRTRSDHVCGVISNGDAYCIGQNGSGQLGTGTTTPSATPVKVSGGLKWRAASSSGFLHSCGLSTQGVAYCWGATTTGAMGLAYDPNQQSLVPAEVWLNAP